MLDEETMLPDLSDRFYERGFLVAHSSDGISLDIGLSVGLGDGKMLYAGERPGKPGWSICVYPISGDGTDIAIDVDVDGAKAIIEMIAGVIGKPIPFAADLREASAEIKSLRQALLALEQCLPDPDIGSEQMEAAKAEILRVYGRVIGEQQAENIAYTVLSRARSVAYGKAKAKSE